MIELILLVLRAVQALFAVIVLGLAGHLAATALPGDSPSQVNFMVFVAVWTLLILIYLGLAPKLFPAFAHTFAMFGLDVLTMLFWFAGFIALAVLARDIEAYANYFYFTGCATLGDYCPVSEAASVFGGFEWALFAATTILSALDAFKNRRGKHDTQPSVGPAVA